MIQLESDNVENYKDNNYSSNIQKISKLKTLYVDHMDLSALRFGVSNRAAASIGTAKFKAVKDAGFTKDNVPDTSQALDHKKIESSKQRVIKTCEEKHNKDEEIQSIMFNGRKGLTKTVVYGEDGKSHKRETLEDHNCICSEPGEKYLFHFVNNPEERGDSC